MALALALTLTLRETAGEKHLLPPEGLRVLGLDTAPNTRTPVLHSPVLMGPVAIVHTWISSFHKCLLEDSE